MKFSSRRSGLVRTFILIDTLRNLSLVFDTNNKLPLSILVQNGVQDYNDSVQIPRTDWLARNLTESGRNLPQARSLWCLHC